MPSAFPDAVLREADIAARRPVTVVDRFDARDLGFATLDPASSTDLDQAFFLQADGDDIVLRYAIADVGFFVERGSALEAEAWSRGSTIYAPDGRVPQYPETLSEAAASLLPDVDRPAVLLTVRVDTAGLVALERVCRAVVRSRAKLGYEDVTPVDLSPLLPEFQRRVAVAEETRGASRIEFPEQEVESDPSAPGGLRLVARDRLATEDLNAAMSLAANLAVAQRMLHAGEGLFRVMAEPGERSMGALRHTARALGLDWPRRVTAREFAPTLNASDPRHAAFLRAIRRAGGGAGYAVFDAEMPPWHSAMSAPYAHATAPLRRLSDRYVLDLLVDLDAGQMPDQAMRDLLASLPATMDRAEDRASRVERAAIDLVEAVVLSGRVGESFVAIVTDTDRESASIQLGDPAVRARVSTGGNGVTPGADVTVRLSAVDVPARRVEFNLVA